jgi:hypothetical protein
MRTMRFRCTVVGRESTFQHTKVDRHPLQVPNTTESESDQMSFRPCGSSRWDDSLCFTSETTGEKVYPGRWDGTKAFPPSPYSDLSGLVPGSASGPPKQMIREQKKHESRGRSSRGVLHVLPMTFAKSTNSHPHAPTPSR